MYPSAPDDQYPQEKHAADRRPIPGLIPNPSMAQPYHAPYIPRLQVPAAAAAGRWSTGLCHCCDDPANCTYFLTETHLRFSQIIHELCNTIQKKSTLLAIFQQYF